MNVQEIDNENIDQQLDQFWDNFQLFPSKWERFIFENFFPWVGVSILPYLVLVAGSLLALIFLQVDQNDFKEKLTDWQMIIVVVGLILISPPYLRWQSKIPEIFQWLLKAEKVRGEDLKKRYLEFLTGYQQVLFKSPRRYIFSAVFCSVVLFYNLLDLDAINLLNGNQSIDTVTTIIKRVFGLLFWGYTAGLAVWPVFATGSKIYELSTKFQFNIHSRHPDRCGGLKPLGDFCFSMTLPIVVGGVILVLFGIGGLLNNITYEGFLFNDIGENTILSANLLLLVVVLPLTVAIFFLPLWNVHREMVKQKTNYEDEFSNEVLQLEDQLRTSIRKERGWEEARVAKEKIELLQVLNPQSVDYPVWPFRYNLVISLFSPQILGIISTIISVIEVVRPKS